MNIVVPIKLVPDLVEELIVDSSGMALDASAVRPRVNEFDEHAIEQAILLKEKGLGPVTILAPDLDGADEILYTAAAKGADRLFKLTGILTSNVNNHAMARVYANAMEALQLRPELVLTGVQAHNDLDGPLGPRLAEQLGMAYVGYVSGVSLDGGRIIARKEYPGGLIAEVQVTPPVVLGVQAAEKPPRYIPVSKVRQVMKATTIDKHPAAELELIGVPMISRIFLPEASEQATMLAGNTEEVAARLVEIFKEQGIL